MLAKRSVSAENQRGHCGLKKKRQKKRRVVPEKLGFTYNFCKHKKLKSCRFTRSWNSRKPLSQMKS